jgi:hypothetical protein
MKSLHKEKREKRRKEKKERRDVRKIKRIIERGMTEHHRKPTSIGGEDIEQNISVIPKHMHEHWHGLFSNLEAPTICALLNEKYIDPEYIFICEKRSKEP